MLVVPWRKTKDAEAYTSMPRSLFSGGKLAKGYHRGGDKPKIELHLINDNFFCKRVETGLYGCHRGGEPESYDTFIAG